MIDDLSEKEQIALFKKWWKDYGWALLIAILIGLLIGFGWRYWHQYKVAKANQSSNLYMAMLILSDKGDADKMADMTKEMNEKFSSTPYAVYVKFDLAKKAVTEKKYEDAIQSLDWVMDHATNDSFKAIASLRKARVLLATKKYSEALAVVDAIDVNGYQSLIDDTKGDIYAAQDKSSDAVKYYLKAQAEYEKMGQTNALLSMKIAQYPDNTKSTPSS